MSKVMKSSPSTMMDDVDAITPCPLVRGDSKQTAVSQMINPIDDYQRSRSTSPCSECSSVRMEASRSRRRASIKTLEEGTDGDPERLWKRMLALQQIYGCYNSARMSAALTSGDISLLLPSRACLDLLNENMAFLPDEVEPVIGDWRPDMDRQTH
ncbi:hypothetical protein F4779DRAFT_419521 [Xylariaceae sp. FL0662B]|nr:hypothetical protein F4779DRAFT_419521 [Xylariaceae sp. FL0662B]